MHVKIKGEWGEHNKIHREQMILHEGVDKVVDYNLADLIKWCSFRPITADHPSWLRKAFPARNPDDLILLIEHFNEEADKLFVVLSVYLKQPGVTLTEKKEKLEQFVEKFSGVEGWD